MLEISRMNRKMFVSMTEKKNNIVPYGQHTCNENH